MTNKHNKDIHVALLIGGWSAEREVSLHKGLHVAEALKKAGFRLSVVDVTKDLPAFIESLQSLKPDVVFNNLYGQGGEDGTIQAVLDFLGLAYTHSGVMASAVGMHKIASKIMVQSLNIQTASYQKLDKNQSFKDIKIPKPYVVKPISEGSSVGISIVHPGDNHTGLEDIHPEQLDRYMVEAYVPGEELTVAVLNGKAQAVTAIKSGTKFFDYHAKYRAEDTQYQLPAKIPHDVYQKAMTWSEDLYQALGCDGIARCDYRYDPQDQDNEHLGLYFLEINTQPGLTKNSIGPAQAGYNGMSFANLCADMVHSALSKKQLR